jgi:hypothetical protein
MSDFELISDEDYANLPEDKDLCFVEFERIYRRNMTELLSGERSKDFDDSLKMQYMTAIAAVAMECEVPNIEFNPQDFEYPVGDFGRFSLVVQAEVARIKIRQRGGRDPYSVLLLQNTRTKIEFHVGRIRDAVTHSDLSEEKKKRLAEKLDQLIVELSSQRLNFGKALAILAAVSTLMSGPVTIAAEGPAAVTHILTLIGHDKATEDEASRRLAPPPKALPKPNKPEKQTMARHHSPMRRRQSGAIDDDIPF